MRTNNFIEDTSTDSKDSLKISEQYEYVNGTIEVCKETLGSKEIPDDFYTWPVKEQCDWINENLEKLYPNVPKSMLNFIPAYCSEINKDISVEKLPPWLDKDKYRRGQKFVKNHYGIIIMFKIVGLLYSYTFEDILKPIILAKRSHTLYLAFKRYMSTIKRMINWYDGEPWIKSSNSYKELQFVHGMHLRMSRKLCELNKEQVDAACAFANPRCPDNELLQTDFVAACPFEKLGRPYLMIGKSPYRSKGINNGDITVVQICLIISPLLNPKLVGIHDATDEDLEAFCHMWRCYGYFLGLEDEYNFCRGSLEEVRERMRDFRRYWLMPHMAKITSEWEHVTRCIVESLNYYHPLLYVLRYKVMTLIAMDGLDINMPHLYASLSYFEWILYEFLKFGIRYLLRFSIIRSILNKFVLRIIHEATNFKADKMTKLHKKSIKILPDFNIVY